MSQEHHRMGDTKNIETAAVPPLVLAGNLSGVAHPSAHLRRMVGQLYEGRSPPTLVDRIADDALAIEKFAGLLTESIEKCVTQDGRVDMRDVAAYVLRVMRDNQR